MVLGEGNEREGSAAGDGDEEGGGEEEPVRETRATARRRTAGGGFCNVLLVSGQAPPCLEACVTAIGRAACAEGACVSFW